MKNILRKRREKKRKENFLFIYSRKLKSYTGIIYMVLLILFHYGLGIKAAINNVIPFEKWLMFQHVHRCINYNDLY